MVNWRNSLLWLCLTLCQYETFWWSLLYLNKEKPYLKLEILRPLANSACPLTSLWREFCRKCCICLWLVVIFLLIKNCSDLINFDLIWLLLLWFNFFWVDFDTISYLQVMWNWDPYAIKEESSFLNVRRDGIRNSPFLVPRGPGDLFTLRFPEEYILSHLDSLRTLKMGKSALFKEFKSLSKLWIIEGIFENCVN